MDTITLDPVEEYLDARNLDVLIDRWLLSLDKLDLSTRVTYRDRIAHFRRWWAIEAPARDWRLTQAALQKFEEDLRCTISDRFGKELAYTTRHAVSQALRRMFRWAAVTGRTPKNYGEWVPWPNGNTPQRKPVTVAQLAQLMLAASQSPQALRDQAILAFFIGTGCRLGEVAALNVEDLTILADGSGTAKVIGKRTSANKTGKREVAFDSATGKWILRYQDALQITAGVLWLTGWGDRLDAHGIYQMVRRTIKRAGLTEHVRGCHDLRRAFATILSAMNPDSPGWADLIRRQLGHKNFSMTAHYILLTADDIRARIVSPIDGMEKKAE